MPQVELAALNYQKTRLVRIRGKGGARLGFGAGGEAEVVSARGYVSLFLLVLSSFLRANNQHVL